MRHFILVKRFNQKLTVEMAFFIIKRLYGKINQLNDSQASPKYDYGTLVLSVSHQILKNKKSKVKNRWRFQALTFCVLVLQPESMKGW